MRRGAIGLSFSTRITTVVALAFTAGLSADTISFQNGVNGYTGTVQIRMTSGLAAGSTGGSINDPDFVQCRKYVPGTTEGSSAFWRFDNMFGNNPGQIPPNSTITSARFELRTVSNVTIPGLNPPLPHGTGPLSTGPMCLARMKVPVDEARLTLTQQWGVCGTPPTGYCPIVSIIPAPNPPLIWVWFGAEGPDYAGGDYDRPVGGFIDMTVSDRVESADVTWIVQEWARGADNYGFILFADVTDAWSIEGTGKDYHYPDDVTRRPKLVVDYVPSRTQTFTFQQDLNGYTGCSMIRVGQDGASMLGQNVDVTTANAFLDGGTGPTDPEFDAIIKFDDVFGYGYYQVPPNRTVLKAYLTLTTPSLADDVNDHSKGPYAAHRMLVEPDWTGTNHPAKPFLWSEFANGDGPTVADNEIGPALSSVQALTYDGRAYFDVTSAVLAWKSGQPNYGIVVKPGTTDGWKIHWTNSGSPVDVRPQLVLMVVQGKSADFNNDTFVDGSDFLIFQDCATRDGLRYAGDCAKADFDSDTDVDMDDFAVFQSCFNGANPASIACRAQ